jgi:flagellar protein FlaG
MAQQIGILQRVRHFLHLETLALIRNPDRKDCARPVNRHVNMHLLVPVVAIPMHNGVHHAFPNSHADPVAFVFIEACILGRLENLPLGKIDAFKGGWVIFVEQDLCACIQFHVSRASIYIKESVIKKRYHNPACGQKSLRLNALRRGIATVPCRAMTPSQPRIVLEKSADYRESYANSVQIRVNLWDFFMMFGNINQTSPDNVQIHNFQGIYVSPQQAKALLNVLQQNVSQYEAAFGEIRLEPKAGSGFVQ